MRIGKVLAFCVVGSLAACTSSVDDEPTRRRTAVVGDDKKNTDDGKNEDKGKSESGVVLVDLTSTASPQVVGNVIELTARIFLDAAKTKPVTDGTSVTFSFTPSTSLNPSGGNVQTVGGMAKLTVDANAATKFSATATALGVTSEPLNLEFTTQAEVGVGTVFVSPSRSSVTIADPNSTDDQATINITVIDENGNPWQGPLKVTASDGSLSDATPQTDPNGNASVLFQASTRLGDVTITVSAGERQGSTSITVGPGAPLMIEALTVQPAQIGIKGSGGAEASVVSFQVQDQFRNPVSDSTLVTFSIEPKSFGATIHPSSGGLNTVGGVVSPVIKAGLRSGTVRVIASVVTPLSPTPISASSQAITIFGGMPDASHMSLSVLPGDRVQSGFVLNGLEARFTVRLTDLYGNPVVPGTAVKVYCEAGACGINNPSGLLTDQHGIVNFSLFSDFPWLVWNSGNQTQLDFGGGIGTNHSWPTLGQPVDGRVNVIAVAQGRTSFDDANANGIYDPGEQVTYDPVEPFIDVNSNSTRDVAPFEIWEDFSIEGLVDPHMVNGTWDDHTPAAYHDVQYIWKSNEVVWATQAELQAVPLSMVDINTNGVFDPQLDEILLGNPDASVDAHYFGAASTTFTSVRVYFGDLNRNALPAGSRLSFEIIPSEVASEIEIVDPEAEFVPGFVNAQMLDVILLKKNPGPATGVGVPFIFNVIVDVPDTGIKTKLPMYGTMY